MRRERSEPPRDRPREELEHGSYHSYNYYKCRCDLCREANNRRKQRERERAKLRAAGLDPDAPLMREEAKLGARRSIDLDATQGWLDHALCRTYGNPEDFFPPENGAAVAKRAKKVCAECPVLAQCGEWSLTATTVNAEESAENFLEGILAGTTYRERAAERARRGIKKVGRSQHISMPEEG